MAAAKACPDPVSASAQLEPSVSALGKLGHFLVPMLHLLVAACYFCLGFFEPGRACACVCAFLPPWLRPGRAAGAGAATTAAGAAGAACCLLPARICAAVPCRLVAVGEPVQVQEGKVRVQCGMRCGRLLCHAAIPCPVWTGPVWSCPVFLLPWTTRFPQVRMPASSRRSSGKPSLAARLQADTSKTTLPLPLWVYPKLTSWELARRLRRGTAGCLLACCFACLPACCLLACFLLLLLLEACTGQGNGARQEQWPPARHEPSVVRYFSQGPCRRSSRQSSQRPARESKASSSSGGDRGRVRVAAKKRSSKPKGRKKPKPKAQTPPAARTPPKAKDLGRESRNGKRHYSCRCANSSNAAVWLRCVSACCNAHAPSTRADTPTHYPPTPIFSLPHPPHTHTEADKTGRDGQGQQDGQTGTEESDAHTHARTHARTQTQHNANARACFSPQISHGSKEDHALTRTTNLEERTTFLHTSTHTHTPYVHTYTHTYTHFIGYLLHSPLQLIILGVNA